MFVLIYSSDRTMVQRRESANFLERRVRNEIRERKAKRGRIPMGDPNIHPQSEPNIQTGLLPDEYFIPRRHPPINCQHVRISGCMC
jgi:hypothetical protein